MFRIAEAPPQISEGNERDINACSARF